MLSTAHITIAKQVRNILKEKFHADITPVAFLFGSIFPDISRKTRNNKHNFGDAVLSVKEVSKLNSKSRVLKSFKLGIVCHYTADSFCDAHIKPKKYSKIEHFKYEMNQSFHVKHEMERARKIAQMSNCPPKKFALASYLQRYRKFIERKHSYADETTAAVTESVRMIKSLI